MKKIDYLIVGQGIAGTWLSYELIRRGHQVMILNQASPNTSSQKAAGLYNPITGRKMLKTWRADDLFEHLEADYFQLEEMLGSRFIYPKPIYRPFLTVEDQNDWQGKLADAAYAPYLVEVAYKSRGIQNVLDPFGGILLRHTGYVDLPALIGAYSSWLQTKGCYQSELFDATQLQVKEDCAQYKDWEASKIIFCEGVATSHFWQSLPFRPVRGEIIDVKCDLPTDVIINQGVFIIPKEDYFTVGSSYDHSLLTYEPQPAGIRSIEERLQKIFKGKVETIAARAGIRPATHDRKPYIGMHKESKTLAIFNGFGTKGVSLCPYFARHFVDVLEGKSPIDKEVDVQRVY